MLGLDVGGRFLRGAICDLRGNTRARLDVEIEGSDAGRVLDQISGLRERLVAATGLDGTLLNGAVAASRASSTPSAGDRARDERRWSRG